MENMRLRPGLSPHAIVRSVAQWVLPVLAVAAMFAAFCWIGIEIRSLKSFFVFDTLPYSSPIAYGKLPGLDKLTPDQKLVLQGDRTRETAVEREKAIWEKWPTNIVYLHNYITCLASSLPYHGADGKTNYECRANFAQEITKLQPLDPGNARLDYFLAANLLAESIKEQNSATNTDGTVTNKWGMKVVDRAKFDQAMAHFKAGLGKPEFRRYTSEMVVERLAIMGEPTTLIIQIAEIGMAAGVLLPDLSTCRQLGRASMAYANLLIEEGRTKEAGEFLSACRKFVPQINDDAYTLIDVLVVGAIAGIYAEQVPAAYNRLGDVATAHLVEIETAALAQPIKDWKKRQKEFSKDLASERIMRRHSGILVGLLLPAFGEYLAPTDLAPSRLLEYVVAERHAVGAISICLVVLMVFCVLFALYYHLINKAVPRSVFLLPRVSDWGRLLLWGVLLPVLCYYGVTRWGPWCGRELNVAIECPQFVTQFIALLLVIVAVTLTMVSQWVRRGCNDLLLLSTPAAPFFWRAWGWNLVGMTVLLSVLPESWLAADDRPDHVWTAYLPTIIGGTLILSGLMYLVYAIMRRDWFRKNYAAYYGSLTRALITAIALVTIALNCICQPWLFREERHWIAKDTVMHIDSKGGFTAIEARLVQRLKAEMQQAAAKFPEVRISPGNL